MEAASVEVVGFVGGLRRWVRRHMTLSRDAAAACVEVGNGRRRRRWHRMTTPIDVAEEMKGRGVDALSGSVEWTRHSKETL